MASTPRRERQVLSVELVVHCRDEIVRGLAEVALLPPPQKCGDADADAAAALDHEWSVAAALQAAARGAPAGASVSVRVELANSSSSSVLMARAEAAEEHDESPRRPTSSNARCARGRSNGWPVS